MEYVQALVIAAIIILIINHFLMITRVEGASMFPTFHTGNYLVFDRVNKKEKIASNTVISASYENIYIVKRLIASGGDKVVIKEDGIYVNDVKIVDASQDVRTRITKYEYTLSPDEVFIVGDNAVQSYDSRIYGPIKRSAIIGKLIYKIPGT